MVDWTQTRYTRRTTLDGLDALQVHHPGFEAALALQGAHLVHFAPTGDNNWLWMSPTARFQPGVAIRGGIPVCWPWFGDPDRNPDTVKERIQTGTAHGFARTAQWSVDAIEESGGQVVIILALDANAGFPWTGQARASLTFRFRPDALSLQLTTHNTGEESLTITQALHTYLPTDNIGATQVYGFDHCHYLDTLDSWQRKSQTGRINFDGETDRIYQGAPDLDIHSPPHRYRLTAKGSQSTVVWNPGPEKAGRLSDFPDDAWTGMLCVETANAADDGRQVAPGTSHVLSMTLARN